jgi:hypothetical protein
LVGTTEGRPVTGATEFIEGLPADRWPTTNDQ